MELRGKVVVSAELAINDKEAEVLNLLCSFDLAEWFTEKCSRERTKEEIRSTLANIREQTRKIVTARNKALGAISSVERE